MAVPAAGAEAIVATGLRRVNNAIEPLDKVQIAGQLEDQAVATANVLTSANSRERVSAFSASGSSSSRSYGFFSESHSSGSHRASGHTDAIIHNSDRVPFDIKTVNVRGAINDIDASLVRLDDQIARAEPGDLADLQLMRSALQQQRQTIVAANRVGAEGHLVADTRSTAHIDARGAGIDAVERYLSARMRQEPELPMQAVISPSHGELSLADTQFAGRWPGQLDNGKIPAESKGHVVTRGEEEWAYTAKGNAKTVVGGLGASDQRMTGALLHPEHARGSRSEFGGAPVITRVDMTGPRRATTTREVSAGEEGLESSIAAKPSRDWYEPGYGGASDVQDNFLQATVDGRKRAGLGSRPESTPPSSSLSASGHPGYPGYQLDRFKDKGALMAAHKQAMERGVEVPVTGGTVTRVPAQPLDPNTPNLAVQYGVHDGSVASFVAHDGLVPVNGFSV